MRVIRCPQCSSSNPDVRELGFALPGTCGFCSHIWRLQDLAVEMENEREVDLARRLRSLKVLLGADSPEVRGWAPVVQQEAQATVNAAIAAIANIDRFRADALEEAAQRCDAKAEQLLGTLAGPDVAEDLAEEIRWLK